MDFDTKELLKMNINMMKLLWVWPKNEAEIISNRIYTIKAILLVLSMQPVSMGIMSDMFRQVVLGLCDNFTNIFENILTEACILTFSYFVCCLYINKANFLYLNPLLEKLNGFGAPPDQAQIERKQRVITVGLMIYGTVGITMYILLPVLYLEQCKEERANSKYSQDMACGLFTRVWFPFRIDYFPVYEIVQLWLCYMSYNFVYVSFTMSTLQMGYVLHIVGHIRNMKVKLHAAFHSDNVKKEVEACVGYHTGIIEFCTYLNKAYAASMLIHISVTSLVVSVLAFELLLLDSMFEAIRFVLHMLGWLTILFLVCWNGQKLINESADIAVEAYNTDWPDADVAVQKDIMLIILRAQKPLVLKSSSFGYLSFEKYMAMISTSYSYFTLLANFT